MIDEDIENGGVGSGNFGHAGRPGKVGGSSPYEKGYSKPKREVGQKLREAITPEREKAKIQLQDYKQLYKQKSKEHLDKLRQQYKQEYKKTKDYLKEQDKIRLKEDKEEMYTDSNKPDKKEVRDKLAELKQQYKDITNKELYRHKKQYKERLEDIKQADKEKYKQLYQEQKDKIMGKYKEEYKKRREELRKEPKKEEEPKQVAQPTTQQTQTTQTDDNAPIQLMGHNFTKDDLKNFVDKYKDSTNKDETHYIASNLILNNKDIKIHGFGGVKGFQSTCFLAEKNGKQAWLNPKDVTPDGKLTAQAETKLQKGVTREQQPDPSKNVFTKDYMMQKETANDFYFQTDSMNGEEGFTIKIPKKDVSVPNTEDHKNEYSIPKDVYEKAKREAIWKKAQQDPAHYSKKYDLKQLEEEFKPKLTPQMTEKIKIQPKTPPPAQIQTSQGYSLELGRVKNFIQEIIDKTEDQTQLNKNGGFKEAILLLNQHDTKNQPITRTNNSVLIKQGDKQGWIPNSYINNDGTLTKAGQKILDEAPKKEYKVKISDEQAKDYTYLKRLDPIQESKTDIKVPVWYKDEYLKRNKIGDVKIPRDFLLADGNSLAIKKTDLEKLVKEQLNYNNPYSEDLYLGTSN